MSDDAERTDTMVRPELRALDPAARRRVAEQIAAKGGHCECCGTTEFDVGDALFLGFLFLDEDHDAYMIALTCRNPDCAKPRTGIVLSERDFRGGPNGGGGTALP
ncbi:hypothetical protein [Mycobacterium terramassiliense]|uniref:Uncharacterized protein n=1 Tax=Mycobacterium terramassiliense TaxID=1841859 RepID=A0A2U3NA72_9MYCO|nr:hypothetical protein [Mycobacterium terramassiliense]SPM28357.1 hypothetical protein MTAB308_1843 [Mycobacterium terramassiliense]